MSDADSSNLRRSFLMWLPETLDAPPPSVEVEVEFGARSQRGPERSVNDDHYLILRLERQLETVLTSLADSDLPTPFTENAYGMVLADGLGAAGEAASRLAIATLVRIAVDFGKWHLRVAEPVAAEMMDRARRFYRDVDSALRQDSYHSQRRLQTTLTGVYTAGRELFFAHVGHSRAYVFRDDQLIQLTRDHTLERGRPDLPAFVDVSAGAQDQHHIVTETLGVGGGGYLQLDVQRCGLLDGDLVLLCTNGLTDAVDDARIADALRRHSAPDRQSEALVDLAVAAGGADDVTALVAQYRIRARVPPAAAGHES